MLAIDSFALILLDFENYIHLWEGDGTDFA